MIIREFREDEHGAVTANWVVMTAAIVGIGMAVLVQMSGGLENATGNITSSIGEANTVSGVSQATIGTAPATRILADTIRALQEAGLSNRKTRNQLKQQIVADAPEGYKFSNRIDVATELPVYQSLSRPRTYSVGGGVMTKSEYNENVEIINFRAYFNNNK